MSAETHAPETLDEQTATSWGDKAKDATGVWLLSNAIFCLKFVLRLIAVQEGMYEFRSTSLEHQPTPHMLIQPCQELQSK
jgi:hypothetical protein